jgi:hypothetical protein
VTTLSAKADSFSGHACGNPLRSVPKAQPEPEYVPGSVHVPVGNVAARAAMRPIRERLLDLRHRTARATRLRGVLRVYRNDSHASFFRFACEDVDELSPTGVVRGLREPRAGYALDVEGFVSDETVGIHELSRLLVVEVPALVGRLLVQLRNAVAGLVALGRALLLARQRTLRPPELLLSLAVVARGLYRRAIRGYEEALQSEVYPNSGTVSGSFGGISEVARKDHIPLAAQCPLYRDGFDAPLDRTMQLDLDVPDVLDVEPSGASVILESAAVTVGRELDRTEPAFGLEARVAGTLPRLDPAEERLERFVEPPQSGLSGREVEGRKARRDLPGVPEPSRLFAVGDGPFFGLLHVPTFSKSKVVQAAVSFEHRIQGFFLGAVGEQPVFERFSQSYPLRVSWAAM